MATLSEVKEMCQLAEDWQLEGREILKKYRNTELASIYNGIGPDAFPEWLRDAISALHPSLAVVAFIHDVEWHESDRSRKKFTESNERFRTNGYIVAKRKFGWYDPRRYAVMNQARRFGNICQIFGWEAWCSPCQCAVCVKKQKEGK
jgi:hypothetical protein